MFGVTSTRTVANHDDLVLRSVMVAVVVMFAVKSVTVVAEVTRKFVLGHRQAEQIEQLACDRG